MNEFVDKDGTVYHKGKEMAELKELWSHGC